MSKWLIQSITQFNRIAIFYLITTMSFRMKLNWSSYNPIPHQQLHRGRRSQGAENPGEILHPAAGNDRKLLHHVAPDQRPKVPRLGLGCRPGAGALLSLGQRFQRPEERVPGGADQGRRSAELLFGRNAEGGCTLINERHEPRSNLFTFFSDCPNTVPVPVVLGRFGAATGTVDIQHGGPPVAHQGCQPIVSHGGRHTIAIGNRPVDPHRPTDWTPIAQSTRFGCLTSARASTVTYTHANTSDAFNSSTLDACEYMTNMYKRIHM